MAAQLLKPFLLKHGNNVRLTFHNFPLDGSCNPYAPHGAHQVACPFAKASLCASKQNKFWEFHDQVYDRQDEGLNLGMIDEIAGQVGIDKDAFQTCLKDPATEMQLQKDMQLGEVVALESTPTLIINGHKLAGARTPAELEELLYSIEKQTKH